MSPAILVVDDHPDTARLLCQLLRSRRYQVHSVGDVCSAREAIARETFDLLISDISLPDGDGLELMRGLGASRPIKGIALSGFASAADVSNSLAAGFSRHLSKPVDLRLLLSVIEELVGPAKAL